MIRRAPRGGRDLVFRQETVRGSLTAPRISAVPAAPSWLLGACAFEGRAISVIDVVAFAAGTAASRDPLIVVIIATPAGVIGVPADAPLRDEPRAGDLAEGRDVVVDAATLPERISRALFECGFPPQG
ncbi:MAG: chemotaxis protein CheW [Pseudomonadota bacterium]|nr:chemotaxis protein CheW [Pseudomonadota bacterium]